jgi:hypothetical protein
LRFPTGAASTDRAADVETEHADGSRQGAVVRERLVLFCAGSGTLSVRRPRLTPIISTIGLIPSRAESVTGFAG